MKTLVAVAALGLLGGCGAAAGLKPAANASLPVAPYGARTAPDANALLSPPNQARPRRSDDLLTSSDQRRADDFDLPPAG